MAKSGVLDVIMIRYNAAHRGAERDLFPVTQPLGLPVIAYTALRWGALIRPTPEDLPSFSVPRPPAWYRFVLQHPAVSVTLSAPQTRAELDEDLSVLTTEGPLADAEYAALAEHGERIPAACGRVPLNHQKSHWFWTSDCVAAAQIGATFSESFLLVRQSLNLILTLFPLVECG
jgi:aryl-alcohol dehydrogenase-like predicted oxidoreductase